MKTVTLTAENVEEFAKLSGFSVEETQEKLNATLAQNKVAILLTDEVLIRIPIEILAHMDKNVIIITNKYLFEKEAERPLFNG